MTRRTSVQEEVRKREEKRRVTVPLELVHVNDFVEYDTTRGSRVGKVTQIRTRKRRLRVMPPQRADLPRGSKGLANGGDRGREIVEASVTAILVGRPGKRQSVRPGMPEWGALVKARGKQ